MKPFRLTPQIPTEHDEQKRLFNWAERHLGTLPELRNLFAIPNGGSRGDSVKSRVITGARLKAEGVKAGVPDIYLAVARNGYHGLYIELKRVKGGRLEDDQIRWLNSLNAQGYRAVVCFGWNDARDVICRYLGVEQ
jgi:hypothetical protein